VNDDEFDINKLNLTVKTFTYSLDEYRSYNETNKNIKKKRKRSDETITIRGLFQTSAPGIADTNIEKDLLLKLLYEWAPKNLENYDNISFELTFVNASKQTTDYEKMVSQQLNGKNSKYDFYMIDSVWTGRYGEHLIDLQGKVSAESVNKFAKVNLDSCKYENKLTALPLYSDYGVLLYRKDLLEKYNQNIPETWDQLEYIAEYILEKEGGDLEGFAGQFKAYEGLTCNIYEWIYSFRDEVNTKLNYFNDDFALKALKKLISLLNKSIISTEALIYEESTSLEKWEKGKVLFMRNWPNALQSTEEMFNSTGVKFPFGMARLPGRKVGLSAATLGGWNLGVSKYSNNPFIAARVVEFLTGEYSQKQRALKFSVLPTITNLYSDKDICNVIMCEIYKDIQAINRPSNEENYLDLSQVIYETIHKALENTISAEDAIKTIKKYTNTEYIHSNYPSTILILGCTILLQIIILVIACVILKYRKLKFIQRSNPIYMFIILFGLCLQCFTIYSYVGKPNDNICTLRAWITNIPLTIIIMAIFTQVYLFINNVLFFSKKKY
ncbi:periplasmic binding protein-like II, partial [Piromyces finnis]